MAEPDIALHVLGHVYASMGTDRPLPLSAKGLALLVYLALEGRAHHREHVADLLWPLGEGLPNLRVELSKLRALGLAAFPPRQPMMSLSGRTDLDVWLAQSVSVGPAQVPGWLSALRGPLLSGLDDLGSERFDAWLGGQRASLQALVAAALGGVYGRFVQGGELAAAQAVRAGADRLGVTLETGGERTAPGNHGSPHVDPEDARPPFSPAALWPEPLAQLRRWRDAAMVSPQLVLLGAPLGSRRAVVQTLCHDSAWRTVQVSLAAPPHLAQAAAAQQLARALSLQPPNLSALWHPRSGDLDMVQVFERVREANVPLIVAFHDTETLPAWAVEAVQFMLELPLPLLVVVTLPLLGAPARWATQLGRVPYDRVHRLNLPGLGIEGCRAVGGGDRARAAALAHQSEGWPLYVRAALRGDPDHGRRSPEDVRAALLSALAPLDRAVFTDLGRLAAWPGQLNRAALHTLLNSEAAARAREAGLSAGALVVSADVESVPWPSLHLRPRDTEETLTFASESLRVALASTLTAAQRQEVRGRFGAKRPVGTPPLPEADPVGQRDAVPIWPATAPRRPAPWPVPRREIRTPNGYRVALEGGALEVIRRGTPGPPPALALHLGPVPAGTWVLAGQLDVLQNAVDAHPPAALAWELTGAPGVVLAPGRRAGGPDSAPLPLPLGRPFELRGEGPAGDLTLRVQATDLVLTVYELRWGSAALLSPVHAPGDGAGEERPDDSWAAGSAVRGRATPAASQPR